MEILKYLIYIIYHILYTLHTTPIPLAGWNGVRFAPYSPHPVVEWVGWGWVGRPPRPSTWRSGWLGGEVGPLQTPPTLPTTGMVCVGSV